MYHAIVIKSEAVDSSEKRIIRFGEPSRPVPYVDEQRPGDRLFFISEGGKIEGGFIKPAYHNFESQAQGRTAHIGDFLFKPKY